MELMITLTASFHKLLYSSEKNWNLSLFRFYDEDLMLPSGVKGDFAVAKVTGIDLPRILGLKVHLTGRWTTRRELTFDVVSYEYVRPTTIAEMFLFLNNAVEGIGQKYAKEITDLYGLNSLEVIENNPEEIAKIKGISLKRAKKASDSVKFIFSYQNIANLLSQAGISADKALQVYNELGERDAMKIILENPYEILRVSGIGFKKADFLAKKLGIEPTDKTRIVECLGYEAFSHCQRTGDSYISKEELAQDALETLNAGYSRPVVGRIHVDDGIEKSLACGKLVAHGSAVYPAVLEKAEKETASAVCRLTLLKKDDQDYLKAFDELSDDKENVTLNKQQQAAVRLLAKTHFAVITGSAGTGKTTIIKTMIRCYTKAHPDSNVTLLAPTGKAAQRLSEVTGSPASTIHSALRINSGEMVMAAYEKYLPSGLIIVDEFSMCDVLVAEALFRSISEISTVVIVGDPNQLPSVGPGKVLGELLRAKLVPSVSLTAIMRQTGDSSIIGNSYLVNEGSTGLAYDNSFSVISANLQNAQDRICKKYLEEVEKYGQKEVCVLSPYRDNDKLSCLTINTALQQHYDRGQERIQIGNRLFIIGDRVISTKNTEKTLNGDVGTITSIDCEKSEIKILFDVECTEKSFNSAELQDFQLAYAITVHKSQGSEYSSVIFTLLKEQIGILFQRKLFYTGITRAKEVVCIVGDKAAISYCIGNKKEHDRASYLANRIYGELKCEYDKRKKQKEKAEQAEEAKKQRQLSFDFANV